MAESRALRKMPRAEAMRLVASVRVGRVVFTQRALPAIRPVNHVVLDGLVVFGTHRDSAVATQTAGAPTVVAYEVDQIDEEQRSGWSVVVTGLAVRVEAGERADRYHGRLRPWVGVADHLIAVTPRLVTGFRLVPRTAGASGLRRVMIGTTVEGTPDRAEE
ncbi:MULTISPECIES: pyridoxamine 5'-phosphate oxidase family protein [Micromonospora]|uniref:pyridoxamine 5'-phosphate oxidase family protein n=1 Tax=Micromonospora TaxID=1873 RepID=UPI0018F68B0E|nr:MULTISPECIES: pyridoxamine 5'-phosphate oxidase family protein [Micromonospora]